MTFDQITLPNGAGLGDDDMTGTDMDRMTMAVDIEKNRSYYAGLTEDDVCQCAYCRNFCARVRTAYPDLMEYLATLGIDIAKPLRLSFGPRNEAGIVNYYECQYTAFGSASDDFQHSVGDVTIGKALYHPDTGVTGEHFVLHAGSGLLEYDGEE